MIGKVSNQWTDAALQHVIAQEHDKALIAQKEPRYLDSVCQSCGSVLRNVGDLHAELFTCAHCLPNLGSSITDHDADLADARVADCFNDAEQHRLVGNWDKLLGPC